MLFDFLDRLREKPEEYRVRVALVGAGIITGAIALLWFFTLDFGEKNAERPLPRPSSEQSPVETIKQSFGSFFEESTQQFQELQEVFEQAPTSTERGRTTF